MFSCNLHEFSGFGDACPKCLKELAERHASKTETEFPTTQAAPEWDGDGLPPVGCECEHLASSGGYEKVKVLAHAYNRSTGKLIVFQREDDSISNSSPPFFRPLRTKEQRQRDELADLIENHQMEKGSFCTPENTAEAILSRYNLEPKL